MPTYSPISGQTAGSGGGGGGGTIQTSYVLEFATYVPIGTGNGSIGLSLSYDPKKEYIWAGATTGFGASGVISLSEVFAPSGGQGVGPTYALSPKIWIADTVNGPDIFVDEAVMVIGAGMVNGLSPGFAGGISVPIPAGGSVDLNLKPPVRIDATFGTSGVSAVYFVLASRIVTE